MGYVIADFSLPRDFAVEGQGGGVDGAAVEEVDVNIFTITCDGGGGRGGIGVFAGISARGMNFGLPEKFAVAAVEAKNGLGAARGIGGSKVNMIADDRGRAVSAAWDRRFPDHIVGLAPLGRRVLSGGGDAVAGWAAPGGPVHKRIDGGRDGGCGKKDCDDGANQYRVRIHATTLASLAPNVEASIGLSSLRRAPLSVTA